MQIVSNIALISINETLIVQLISFLIFLFLINRLMFRPLRRVMGERDNYIEKIRQEILTAEKDLENYARQIETEKEAVRVEAFQATRELENEGRQLADEIILKSGKEILALREEALKDLQIQMETAKKEIRTETDTLAVNIMEKVLDRRLVS